MEDNAIEVLDGLLSGILSKMNGIESDRFVCSVMRQTIQPKNWTDLDALKRVQCVLLEQINRTTEQEDFDSTTEMVITTSRAKKFDAASTIAMHPTTSFAPWGNREGKSSKPSTESGLNKITERNPTKHSENQSTTHMQHIHEFSSFVIISWINCICLVIVITAAILYVLRRKILKRATFGGVLYKRNTVESVNTMNTMQSNGNEYEI